MGKEMEKGKNIVKEKFYLKGFMNLEKEMEKEKYMMRIML